MKWENIIKVSYKSLFKNRMRSLLTSLGIIIGVGAVIIMVAIGEGAKQEIENRIKSLGSNLIMIFPAPTQVGGVSQGAGSFNRLTLDDAEMLKENSQLVQGISPMVHAHVQVVNGTNNWSTTIYGVSPSYLNIRDWKLSEGEFFNDRDVLTKNKVAIIGKTIVDNLLPGVDPIGQKIRVNNTPFKIIGILEEKGKDSQGRDQDDMILAPSTTVLARLTGGKYIDMIYANAKSDDLMDETQEELVSLMREAHHLYTGQENDFVIFNQADIINTVSATTKVLTILLGSIAGVSLVVGGIGIMNIMLVSVTERTREIGIRLAIGARASDILVQFLTEAVILSLSGGIIGIALSFLAEYVCNSYIHITVVIQPSIVFLSVFFSVIVGVFFGYYPAHKAALLNPIDALRYE